MKYKWAYQYIYLSKYSKYQNLFKIMRGPIHFLPVHFTEWKVNFHSSEKSQYHLHCVLCWYSILILYCQNRWITILISFDCLLKLHALSYRLKENKLYFLSEEMLQTWSGYWLVYKWLKYFILHLSDIFYITT